MGQLGTEFKVGLFTLVAAIIIGYMFFVLSPETFKSEDYKKFYTEVQDASGVIVKSHVKTNGVIIGKVSAVKLTADVTRIELEIENDVTIPAGSSVAIKEKGLLGDVFVDVIRAQDKGEYIEEGSLIPPAENQASISNLVAIAGAIGQDVKQVTETLAKVMGGSEGEKNLGTIVSELRLLTENARALVEENRQDVRGVVTDFRETTATLRRVIGDREEELGSIVSNVRAATDDLRAFSGAMRQFIDGENQEKIGKIIAAFDNTMQDVEVTAKNVRLVADKLERGEGTLGRLINDDRALTDLEGAIRDIREVIAPATKMQLAVDYHGEIRKDSSTQHYFNTYFQTRPDKLYLIGFTDMSESVRETTYETIPVGDESSDSIDDGDHPKRVRERVSEKKALRFNLQFAKRWGALQMRFGLFESTGGLASDFFLFSDRLRFTVEAFDWNNESVIRRRAHLKTYASILFFKHIYAMIGLDDPTRIDPSSGEINKELNYFMGAGLTFNDEDLKTIFGAASLTLK